jgi:hypothetical protein
MGHRKLCFLWPIQYHIPFCFSASFFLLVTVNTKQIGGVARSKRKARDLSATVTTLPVAFKFWTISAAALLLLRSSFVPTLCMTIATLKSGSATWFERKFCDRLPADAAGPISCKCIHMSLFRFVRCFYKCGKDWVWIKRTCMELRVELNSHKEWVYLLRKFCDFHQLSIG